MRPLINSVNLRLLKMHEILQAIETLTDKNCMTLSEALEKAYLAGHRTAVKELDKTSLSLVTHAASSSGIVASVK